MSWPWEPGDTLVLLAGIGGGLRWAVPYALDRRDKRQQVAAAAGRATWRDTSGAVTSVLRAR